jgi:hypothetical protein
MEFAGFAQRIDKGAKRSKWHGVVLMRAVGGIRLVGSYDG